LNRAWLARVQDGPVSHCNSMTDTPSDLARLEFATLPDLIRLHALQSPDHCALREGDRELNYAQLDQWIDRVAAALQRDGLTAGNTVALCAGASLEYVACFVGALRAGLAVAPLSPGATPESLLKMISDAQAARVFIDRHSGPDLLDAGLSGTLSIALDEHEGDSGEAADILGKDTPRNAHPRAWSNWLAPAGTRPVAVHIQPDWPFNIIYSSGTTGTPKGIVQPHGMRWTHVRRGAAYGYNAQSVTLLATPLYSNTTLVSFLPTLAYGGCAVLMPRFDALAYLKLAQAHRATHTMLVPVQYQRLMAHTDFDAHDLSSFQAKFCTSAHFPAALKADVLKRWPGALVEFYGMTEGGGTCILDAHRCPDKLHTVGRPAEGHDIRLIDEAGQELTAGQTGEVVGRSPGMMTGYRGQPERTREAEWFDADNRRFIRTGDVGRFDEDGFLILLDRRKDMIISGGFNIYPSDLEAALGEHPAVAEAAVVGAPSSQWGETPVGFVVLQAGQDVQPAALLGWVNARLGKTQRLASLHCLDSLPRNAIGKVLKTELRTMLQPAVTQPPSIS
jgi:long-chain acyl-CoA synthetase